MSLPANGIVEERFSRLPLYVKEHLTCLCDVQGMRRFYEERTSVQVKLYDNGNPHNVFFCNLCFKPVRYMVHHVVETCDECEKYYVPGEYPARWKLCARCDGEEPFTRIPVWIEGRKRVVR